MIDPSKVNDIFCKCLFKTGENTDNHIKARGIKSNVSFHPSRIEENRIGIESLLSELPEQFHESKGGGMSFLCASHDKDGNLWTGLHQRIEQLFQLGIGIGKVKCLMPKEMWNTLPGGVPYYVITN